MVNTWRKPSIDDFRQYMEVAHRDAATRGTCTCAEWRWGREGIHQWSCPADTAAGRMCHWHFGQDTTNAQHDACPFCQEAIRAEAEREQLEDTIDPRQPYGQHIYLTCKNHPSLRWHTKNIGYIGARSLFYASHVMPECSCPASDLVVAPFVADE